VSEWIVLLACGHWFRETRNDTDTYPVDGEERRCTPCRSRRFPVVYMAAVDLSLLGWDQHRNKTIWHEEQT
jgi:hypothetical protein